MNCTELLKGVVEALSDLELKEVIQKDREGRYLKIFSDVFGVRKNKSKKGKAPLDDRTITRLALYLGVDTSAGMSGSSWTSSELSIGELLVMFRSKATAGPELSHMVAASDKCIEGYSSPSAKELGRIFTSRLLLHPHWIVKNPMGTACLFAYSIMAQGSDGFYDSTITHILSEETEDSSRFTVATLGFLGLWALRIDDEKATATSCRALLIHHYLHVVMHLQHHARLSAEHLLGLMLLFRWAGGNAALRGYANVAKLPKDVVAFLDKAIAASMHANMWSAVEGKLRTFSAMARSEEDGEAEAGKSGLTGAVVAALDEAERRSSDSPRDFLSWFVSNRELVHLASDVLMHAAECEGEPTSDGNDGEDDDSSHSTEDNEEDDNDGDSSDDEEAQTVDGVLSNYEPVEEKPASAMERALKKLQQ